MSDFKIQLSSDVHFILDRMKEYGYSAHVVGGSVRDSLIGRALSDFDITTNALPEQTKEVFKDYRIIETGIKHGTVTLVLNGTQYEITTYRVDGDYKDQRHPEQVKFTSSLEEDLARRDFTVNAMAYSPYEGLCDPFGGEDDVQRRIIRAVGDPYLRFSEDALRILRALRFASVLGFEIEDSTSAALRELAVNLGSISKERIYTELKKLIMGVDAVKILSGYSSVFGIILGGLTTDRLPNEELFLKARYDQRLASLFLLNSSEPDLMAEKILTELKTDKHTRTYVSTILRAYDSASFMDRKSALITLARCGTEIAEGALGLGALMGRFSSRDEDNFASALSSGIPYKVSDLAVRGTDLAKIGIKGESIGEALTSLVYAVIDGRADNNKDSLISFLKRK